MGLLFGTQEAEWDEGQEGAKEVAHPCLEVEMSAKSLLVALRVVISWVRSNGEAATEIHLAVLLYEWS